MRIPAKLWPWIVVGILVLVAVYSISGILLPFIAGVFLAYAMNPLVTKLAKWHIRRSFGTALIVLTFFLIFGGLMFLAVPFLITELAALARAIPTYGERLVAASEPVVGYISQYVNVEDWVRIRQNASGYIADMISWILTLLAGLLTNTLAIANLISLIVLTPIVAFYLLRDWPIMIDAIKRQLPKDQAGVIVEQASLINQTLGAYIRGQSMVCIILAGIYSLGLTLVGLNFALTIGMATGLLAFIPYVGMLIGVTVAIGVAFAQFDHWTSIGLVALVFVVGQAIEGYFLTPRLVGTRIGLHPVWVIFALLAGGSLFGFMGILVALPTAAAIGVLARFGLASYRDSPYYLGMKTKKPVKSL